MMLKTIEQFVDACRDQTNDEIYDLIEFNCEPVLIDALYALSAQVDPDSPEPIRCVINHLGELHDVKSMKDY